MLVEDYNVFVRLDDSQPHEGMLGLDGLQLVVHLEGEEIHVRVGQGPPVLDVFLEVRGDVEVPEMLRTDLHGIFRKEKDDEIPLGWWRRRLCERTVGGEGRRWACRCCAGRRCRGGGRLGPRSCWTGEPSPRPDVSLKGTVRGKEESKPGGRGEG